MPVSVSRLQMHRSSRNKKRDRVKCRFASPANLLIVHHQRPYAPTSLAKSSLWILSDNDRPLQLSVVGTYGPRGQEMVIGKHIRPWCLLPIEMGPVSTG